MSLLSSIPLLRIHSCVSTNFSYIRCVISWSLEIHPCTLFRNPIITLPSGHMHLVIFASRRMVLASPPPPLNGSNTWEPQKHDSTSLSQVSTMPTSVDESQYPEPLLHAKALLKQTIWKTLLTMMVISKVTIMMTM